MSLQTFCVSEMDNRSSDSLEPSFGEFLNTDDLYEIQHRQATTKPRNTSSRQYVIRAGSVVASRLSRVFTHKNRASILNGRKIERVYRDMFRRDPVRPLESLGTRTRQQDATVAVHRLTRNVVAIREFLYRDRGLM